MKQETRFSHQLIEEFTFQVAGVLPIQICRIESNLTEQGIPDIYLCINGHSIWIETKFGKGDLNSFQKAWHKKHREAGGRSYIVYCFGTEFVVMKGNVTGMESLHHSNIIAAHPNLYEVVKFILRQVEEDIEIGGHKENG